MTQLKKSGLSGSKLHSLTTKLFILCSECVKTEKKCGFTRLINDIFHQANDISMQHIHSLFRIFFLFQWLRFTHFVLFFAEIKTRATNKWKWIWITRCSGLVSWCWHVLPLHWCRFHRQQLACACRLIRKRHIVPPIMVSSNNYLLYIKL